MWERAQSFHSFSLVPFSPHLYMLTNPEALWTKSFWVFIETSLHRHGWFHHWPLAADPTSSPSPIPRGQEGWDWKFQSSNHTIGSYGNQPASFSSVQSLSRVLLFATPWTIPRQASLSITNSQSLPKLMSIGQVMPSNHLILCRTLLFLPSIFISIRFVSNESDLGIRWPKYWSFSFSINPSNEYSGLISFRMDWFDLAVQGTLKSLLQHHSSKVSIHQCSAFFIVQLSPPYMTTGKTIALTR